MRMAGEGYYLQVYVELRSRLLEKFTSSCNEILNTGTLHLIKELAFPRIQGALAMGFVEVRDVWKDYVVGRVRVTALRGVSLDVDSGEFLAVTGPSGSGKSTLIYLLSGLDVPTRGLIRVGEVEVSRLDQARRASWRRRSVGVIFQFFHLIPTLTALENVLLTMELAGVPAGKRVERALELLEFVGLKDKAGRYPWELSGGEQQRVAIARAIAHNPPLILADEPTANLDYENKVRIVELLREVSNAGKTVVFATHDVELARRADRVVHLRDGVVVGFEGGGGAPSKISP
jgi:putative ABC transport system ATP-binding protein